MNDAANERDSLRPLGLPRPLVVRAGDDGVPVEVARRTGSRTQPLGRVEQLEEVWRVEEAWWRDDEDVGVARTYFRVRLDSGRVMALFRDDGPRGTPHANRGAVAPGARSGPSTSTRWYEQPY